VNEVAALMVGIETLPESLADLGFRRPAWHADAACKEHPDTRWFPRKGEGVDEAKAICATCAVCVECLTYALEHPGLQGVWGGSSQQERARMRKR
jgi:WhiB family redox-sensing transcriptional regulator